MFQEALVIHLGQAISKAILKAWLKEAGFIASLAESSTDIISKLGIDLSEKRRTERQFHQIADYVADSLLPFFETEGAKLDEGEKHAVVLALAAGIDLTDLSPFALIKSFDLRSAELSKRILENSADVKWLSQDGRALLARAAAESARYIVEASARLPEFTPTVFTELLQRQSSLDAIAKEVLEELRKLRETTRALNPQESMSRYEQRYRVAISHRNDEVELFGLDAPAKIRRQNLSVAYVTLSMTRKKAPRRSRQSAVDLRFSRSAENIGQAIVFRELASDVQSLASWHIHGVGKTNIAFRLSVAAQEGCDAILASSPLLLIRGEAGSGKTTLLQWLAVNAASQRLIGVLESWNTGVPFLVKLRDYAERALPATSGLVSDVLPEITDGMPAGWVDYILNEGRAIILVDGIDELDSLKRDEVRTWVRGLVKNFPKCRYIITSRPAAIEDNWLAPDGFDEAELLPMSWSDIDNLITHWHEALGAQPSITDSPNVLNDIATKLKRHLRQSRPLAGLATSPLLCAMLCALHYERQQQLPPNRIGVYEAAIRMLLDQRDRARGIGTLKLPSLSEEQKRAFLQTIAYRMLRNGLSSASIGDVIAEVERTVPLIKSLPNDATAGKIVELLVQRSGIIRSPAEGDIDFVHKTFQEFLAAKAIIDVADLPFLASQAHNDTWHETVILSAGLAPLTVRDSFLKALIERGDSESSNRESLYLLAVACLETAVILSPETEQLINHRLHQVIPPRRIRDAKSLSAASTLAIPMLKRKSSFSAREAAASIRALQMIGGEEAIDALETYGTEARKTVVRGLISAWGSFDRAEFARRVLANSPLDNGFLSINKLEGPSGLGYLKKLNGLSVDDCSELLNLDEIGTLRDLEMLVLNGLDKIQSVGALAGLTSLRRLILRQLKFIESLEPISSLKRLSALSIIGAQSLTNLNFVTELPNLNEIDISETPKITLFPEGGISAKLSRLSIPSVAVSDFRKLAASAPDLTRLRCAADGSAANLEGLGELGNLISLEISILPKLDTNVEFIGKLARLRSLHISCHIEDRCRMDFAPLKKLNRCDDLQVVNWDIRSLQDVFPQNIRDLRLSRCTLPEVFPNFSEMHRLEILVLSSLIGLRNIDSLRYLKNLKVVHISNCEDIENYDVLRQLPPGVTKYAFARGNRILP